MERMKYVVGFLFDENQENVVLVRKKKPKWQRDIHFYCATDKKKNIEQARSMEEERIEIHKVNKISDLPVINNLRFLISLAVDEDWYGSFTPK